MNKPINDNDILNTSFILTKYNVIKKYIVNRIVAQLSMQFNFVYADKQIQKIQFIISMIEPIDNTIFFMTII